MAKFLFSMENILKLKYKLEDQEKNNYSQALMKLQIEEEKLSALQQKQVDYEMKLTQLCHDILDIIHIKQVEEAVEIIKMNVKIQKINVFNEEQKVKAAKEKLYEAMKERKIYEKLKEKAFEAFQTEINLAERKEVDELVSFKYGNKYSEDRV